MAAASPARALAGAIGYGGNAIPADRRDDCAVSRPLSTAAHFDPHFAMYPPVGGAILKPFIPCPGRTSLKRRLALFRRQRHRIGWRGGLLRRDRSREEGNCAEGGSGAEHENI